MTRAIPTASSQIGLRALRAMLREGHPLAAMQVFHDELGDIFRISLPGFSPVVMVGPQAARFVLVEARDSFLWRNEGDPVTGLLRRGILVEDGDAHDRLRRLMNPVFHRRLFDGYAEAMWQCTDQVTAGWVDGGVVDMLVEARKIALLILMRTLYQVDFAPELTRLRDAVLGTIRYISPGIWMLWRGAPRPQYRSAIRRMDDYLYRLIRERRARLGSSDEPLDLTGVLIAAGLDDDLIRDQLLTVLIAGHDTNTALLSWSLALLGSHPDAGRRVKQEVDSVLGTEPLSIDAVNRLEYLGMVIKETLRLYPPIHLGSRLAAADIDYQEYRIPAGERVIYSIYLTQRDKKYWDNPHGFEPERHAPSESQTPYTWLAFGGGPRNCIGSALGQMEAKIVLARLFQQFDLRLVERHIRPHMGATLEPNPSVRMSVHRVGNM